MTTRRDRTLAAVALLTLLGGCGGGSSKGDAGNGAGPSSGLDARPANATCLAPEKGGATAVIGLERVASNIALSQPLALLQAPGETARWFVLEKTGRVRVFTAAGGGAAAASDFIDLAASFALNTSSEGGLLGMAFDPDFASNGEALLSFTEGTPMVSIVARFTSLDGGQTLDPGSREDLLRVDQDFGNHDGGNLAFGPDGDLYVGFGDGGSGGDPNGRAQDTTNLLGAMLRLDLDGGTPYAVPADNPFAANARCPADHSSATDCPEIFAWGLRNPWRWSFDTATGDLWVGDVGQGSREEVDRVELGGNYGWNCREGTIAFGSPAPACSGAQNLIEPVYDYDRSLGNSITGGYVYRGAAIPALEGRYLFADYGSGRIWRLVDDGVGGFAADELLDTGLAIASFGQGNDGELYVVDIAGGALYRIVAAPGGGGNGAPVPALLSATGCVDALDPTQPAAGLIPYDVAAPFWSDGALKQRWLALPDGATIAVGADGDFTFPSGTVLMKHFRLGGALVETRLFMRHPDGDWAGYSYEWDAAQSDATLVTGGKVASVGGQSWIFPSGNDCLACHTAAAGFALGPETAELNRSFTYPSTGRTANELATLDAIGLFAGPFGDPAAQPALPDPADPSAPVATRARAYLHTNCAQCHRPGGPTPSAMDWRFSTPLDATLACDAPPQSGDLGLGTRARLIVPGDPDHSVLLERMSRRDANSMPPLASALVDTDGVALVREWIAGLSGCR